jgi:Ca2+/Na+ antiporter
MISREMWYGIAIGTVLTAILSIPLQLATGLLFPSVQRWFDARMKARAFAKSKRMRKEYEEALYFVTYPHRMTHYFLNRSIEVLRLGIFLFIAMLSLIYGPFKTQPGVWSTITWLTAIGVYMFLILVISQSVNQLHEIYYRVEFWGEYKKKVLLELPDVENKGQPVI